MRRKYPFPEQTSSGLSCSERRAGGTNGSCGAYAEVLQPREAERRPLGQRSRARLQSGVQVKIPQQIEGSAPPLPAVREAGAKAQAMQRGPRGGPRLRYGQEGRNRVAGSGHGNSCPSLALSCSPRPDLAQFLFSQLLVFFSSESYSANKRAEGQSCPISFQLSNVGVETRGKSKGSVLAGILISEAA